MRLILIFLVGGIIFSAKFSFSNVAFFYGLLLSVSCFFLYAKRNDLYPAFLFLLLINGSFYAYALFVLIMLSAYMINRNGVSGSILIQISLVTMLLFLSLINAGKIDLIVRLFSVFSAATVLPLTLKTLTNKSMKKVNTDILLLFVLMFMVNFFYKEFYVDNSRLSIFNGTENIAFCIIFSTAFYLLSIKISNVFKLVIVLMLIIFSVTAESRTSVLVPILGLSVYFLRELGVKNTIIFGLVSIAVFLMFPYLNFESRQLSSLMNAYNMLNFGAGIEEFLDLDIRGELLLDGIKHIKEHPILGVGAIQPEPFESYNLESVSTFHNAIIDLLVMYGFLGTSIFCIYFVMTIKAIGLNKRTLTLIIVFLLSCTIQPYMFNFQSIALMVFVCCILNNGLYRESGLIYENNNDRNKKFSP